MTHCLQIMGYCQVDGLQWSHFLCWEEGRGDDNQRLGPYHYRFQWSSPLQTLFNSLSPLERFFLTVPFTSFQTSSRGQTNFKGSNRRPNRGFLTIVRSQRFGNVCLNQISSTQSEPTLSCSTLCSIHLLPSSFFRRGEPYRPIAF